jgi:CheY-like chemotaxis protein
MKKPHIIDIFLADDDSVDRELFSEALGATGLPYTLQEATNGIELLVSVRGADRLPDLVFLDLNMPLMDGRAALKELKADDALKSIPIIMFSTSSASFDVREAYHGGANLFMSKPHDFNELVELLTLILRLGSKYVSFPGVLA